jgi:hypothetical protein
LRTRPTTAKTIPRRPIIPRRRASAAERNPLVRPRLSLYTEICVLSARSTGSARSAAAPAFVVRWPLPVERPAAQERPQKVGTLLSWCTLSIHLDPNAARTSFNTTAMTRVIVSMGFAIFNEQALGHAFISQVRSPVEWALRVQKISVTCERNYQSAPYFGVTTL